MEDYSRAIVFLKSLTYAKTGGYLEIISPKTITKKNQTAFRYRPFQDIYYILLNTLEIDLLSEELIETRGFSKGQLLIEVVLHEIAHFKQFKRNLDKIGKFRTAMLSTFQSKKYKKYEEDVADRYAHYCSKIIIRELDKWIILNNTFERNH